MRLVTGNASFPLLKKFSRNPTVPFPGEFHQWLNTSFEDCSGKLQ
jgi:hypothetical protein